MRADGSSEGEGRRAGGIWAKSTGTPAGALYGTETVPLYECASGCPVANLDAQSGITQDGIAVRRNGVSGGTGSSIVRVKPEGTPDMGYGGAGGASRFFKQFVGKVTGEE